MTSEEWARREYAIQILEARERDIRAAQRWFERFPIGTGTRVLGDYAIGRAIVFSWFGRLLARIYMRCA